MTVKEKVLEILRDWPETRDCDKLMFEYYTKIHQPEIWELRPDGEYSPTRDAFRKEKNRKSAYRAMRTIQREDGMYPPSKQKRAKKDYLATKMRETRGRYMTSYE